MALHEAGLSRSRGQTRLRPVYFSGTRGIFKKARYALAHTARGRKVIRFCQTKSRSSRMTVNLAGPSFHGAAFARFSFRSDSH